MSAQRMHADEVDTDVDLVRRLLGAQFPQWAELSIEPVESAGTDHAIYRVGNELCVRLPRIGWAIGQAEKERVWLPRLAPHLPLALPVPVAQGAPAEGYPYDWSVYRWLAGEVATIEDLADPCAAARDIAAFITALQRIDTRDAPPLKRNSRGTPPAARDAATRVAIAALEGEIDTETATAVWDAALAAREWDRAPVWFHGDLLPGNVLVEDGRVRAVIDFGGLGVGDPACDVMIAWGLFTGASRAAFRAALEVDDAMWARARGHALSQAAMFVPYYADTNPLGVARARHMIDALLADAAS